jgi:hypothetical protein
LTLQMPEISSFFFAGKKNSKTYLNFSHDWVWINLYPCSVSHYQSYKCCSSPNHIELLSLGDHRTSKALIQSKIQLQIGVHFPVPSCRTVFSHWTLRWP